MDILIALLLFFGGFTEPYEDGTMTVLVTETCLFEVWRSSVGEGDALLISCDTEPTPPAPATSDHT